MSSINTPKIMFDDDESITINDPSLQDTLIEELEKDLAKNEQADYHDDLCNRVTPIPPWTDADTMEVLERIIDTPERETKHVPELRPIPTEPNPVTNLYTDIDIRTEPVYLEVRLFTRTDTHFYTAGTFLGTFIVPYTFGCLKQAVTYHSMILKATDLVRRTKPYNTINPFYSIATSNPSFTFATSRQGQYTVSDTAIPRLYNRSIPNPRISFGDNVSIVMTINVDVSPRFDISAVREMAKRQEKEAQSLRAAAFFNPKAEPEKPTRLTLMATRLGPPPQRSFTKIARKRTASGETTKENSTIEIFPELKPSPLTKFPYKTKQKPAVTITVSPLPTPENPEASCSAPKNPRKTASRSKIQNSDTILKPRQLF